MYKELLQQVKEKTWLFSDEDIINEYNKMQTYDYLFDGMKQDPGYVVLFLYKDKGTLFKEEYTSEVMNYLYQESLDPKEDIDKIINKNLKWFYEYTIEDIFVYDMLEYEGYGRAKHYNGYEPTAINVADINIVKSEYSKYKDIIIKIFFEKFSNFCNCELHYEVEKQLKTKYPDISGYPYREDLVDEDNFEWYFIEECVDNWSLVFL